MTECGSFEELLKEHGIDLSRFVGPGLNDRALKPTRALDAIACLQDAGIAILGGDVWEITGKIARHTYDNWCCERNDGEDSRCFAARSSDVARRYIESYPHPPDTSRVFVLVVRPEKSRVDGADP